MGVSRPTTARMGECWSIEHGVCRVRGLGGHSARWRSRPVPSLTDGGAPHAMVVAAIPRMTVLAWRTPPRERWGVSQEAEPASGATPQTSADRRHEQNHDQHPREERAPRNRRRPPKDQTTGPAASVENEGPCGGRRCGSCQWPSRGFAVPGGGGIPSAGGSPPCHLAALRTSE
jgi:hypothetical protein